MNAPLPRTWWVVPGRLLAGGYPGDHDEVCARKKLQCLLVAGVRCFISLQQPGEMSWSGPFEDYKPTVQEYANAMNTEVAFHHFPIPDMDVAPMAVIEQILTTMNRAMAQGDCVYVHCWGGHGRTGMIVGCWLRTQGLSGKEALERMCALRLHDEVLVSWDCPQTDAQRHVILQYRPLPGDVR